MIDVWIMLIVDEICTGKGSLSHFNALKHYRSFHGAHDMGRLKGHVRLILLWKWPLVHRGASIAC